MGAGSQRLIQHHPSDRMTATPNPYQANRSVRHGTCFHRRLSAHHAGAAPHSAVAELGVVRPPPKACDLS